MDVEKEDFKDLMRQQGIRSFAESPAGGSDSAAAGAAAEAEPAAAGIIRDWVLADDRPDLECKLDSWHAPGLERDMKAARRADRPEDKCDLHDCNVEEAWRQTNEFLIDCRQRGKRIVEIVHGHGRTTGYPSVLRVKVRAWLLESDEVVWFCERRKNNKVENNKGSTLLRLRRLRERR